jgi:hypothetical protein
MSFKGDIDFALDRGQGVIGEFLCHRRRCYGAICSVCRTVCSGYRSICSGVRKHYDGLFGAVSHD